MTGILVMSSNTYAIIVLLVAVTMDLSWSWLMKREAIGMWNIFCRNLLDLLYGTITSLWNLLIVVILTI